MFTNEESYFSQDGEPPYCHNVVRDLVMLIYLKGEWNMEEVQSIHPELTQQNFYMLGTPKSITYVRKPGKLGELQCVGTDDGHLQCLLHDTGLSSICFSNK